MPHRQEPKTPTEIDVRQSVSSILPEARDTLNLELDAIKARNEVLRLAHAGELNPDRVEFELDWIATQQYAKERELNGGSVMRRMGRTVLDFLGGRR